MLYSKADKSLLLNDLITNTTTFPVAIRNDDENVKEDLKVDDALMADIMGDSHRIDNEKLSDVIDDEKMAAFKYTIILIKLRNELSPSIIRALISLYITAKGNMRT